MRDASFAVWLIEHLTVFARGEGYEICDAHVRYETLLRMGMETVLCSVVQSPSTDQEQLS
jgi:hypothetical protein